MTLPASEWYVICYIFVCSFLVSVSSPASTIAGGVTRSQWSLVSNQDMVPVGRCSASNSHFKWCWDIKLPQTIYTILHLVFALYGPFKTMTTEIEHPVVLKQPVQFYVCLLTWQATIWLTGAAEGNMKTNRTVPYCWDNITTPKWKLEWVAPVQINRWFASLLHYLKQVSACFHIARNCTASGWRNRKLS